MYMRQIYELKLLVYAVLRHALCWGGSHVYLCLCIKFMMSSASISIFERNRELLCVDKYEQLYKGQEHLGMAGPVGGWPESHWINISSQWQSRAQTPMPLAPSLRPHHPLLPSRCSPLAVPDFTPSLISHTLSSRALITPIRFLLVCFTLTTSTNKIMTNRCWVAPSLSTNNANCHISTNRTMIILPIIFR